MSSFLSINNSNYSYFFYEQGNPSPKKSSEAIDSLNIANRPVIEEAGNKYLHETLLPLVKNFPQFTHAEELFAHIFGNGFIRNTFLEGIPANELPAKFLLSYLKQVYPITMKQKASPFFLTQAPNYLEDAIHWNEGLEKNRQEWQSGEQIKADLSLLVSAMRQKLLTSGSLLFFGGWTGLPTGHVMLYHITRELDGEYTFRIYNSGHGIDYHPGVFQGRKLKFSSVWALDKIKEQEILSEPIISRLLLHTVLRPLHATEQCEPEDIYDFLLFSYKRNLKTTPLLQERLSSAQNAGICSKKVWMAFFRTRSPNQEFFPFKYDMCLFSLVWFWHNNFPAQSVSNKTLFSESVRKFSRSLAAYHQKNYITTEQLRIGHAILQEISVSQAKIPDLAALAPLWRRMNIKSGQPIDAAPPKAVIEQPFITEIPPMAEPECLHNRLVEMVKALAGLQKNGCAEDLNAFFQTALFALPEIYHEGSAWMQVPGAEIEACAKSLFELTEIFCSGSYSKTAGGIIHRLYLYIAAVELFKKYLQCNHAVKGALHGLTLIDIEAFDTLGLLDKPVITDLQLLKRYFALKNYHLAIAPGDFLFSCHAEINRKRPRLTFDLLNADPKTVFAERFIPERLLKAVQGTDKSFPAQIYIQQDVCMPKLVWMVWRQYFSLYWNTTPRNFNLVEETPGSVSYEIGGEALASLWSKACKRQSMVFQDPCLRKIMRNELSGLSLSAEESILTHKQKLDLIQVQKHKHLRVPEIVNFFRKNYTLLSDPQGRAALVYLLFQTRAAMYSGDLREGEINPGFTESIPLLAEMKSDPYLGSVFGLHSLLRFTAEHASKARDFGLLDFVHTLDNRMRECMHWLHVDGQLQDLPQWPEIMEDGHLHLFAGTASLEEIGQMAPFYLERAQRRKAFDAHWACFYAKTAYMLHHSPSTAPNHAIIKKRLGETKGRVGPALAGADIKLLLKTVFAWSKLPESSGEPSLDIENDYVKWGDCAFNFVEGSITKSHSPVYCIDNFLAEHHAVIQALIGDQFHAGQFTYDPATKIFLLSNGEIGISYSHGSHKLLCKGSCLQKLIRSYSEQNHYRKIQPSHTYLLMDRPAESIGLSDSQNADYARAQNLLDYAMHPKFHRWYNETAKIHILLDLKEKRAFLLDQGPAASLYDLTTRLVRYDSLHFLGYDWFCCFPEHPLHIWTWTDPSTHVLRIIELPRFGLRFIHRNGEFHSEQYSGFWLDKTSKPVPNVAQIIVLINEEGRRMMLVPRTSFEPWLPPVKAPLDPRLRAALEMEAANRFDMFVFFRESEAQRLHPYEKESLGYWSQSPKAVLFLAGLHLHAHNYQEALHYLEKYPHDKASAKEEIQELLEAIEQGKNCFHPNHQAVLLHFIKKCLDLTLEGYICEKPAARLSAFPYIPTLFFLLYELVYDVMRKLSSIDPAFYLTDEAFFALFRPEYGYAMPDCLQNYFSQKKMSLVPQGNIKTSYPLKFFLLNNPVDWDFLFIPIKDDFQEWSPKNFTDEVRPKVGLSKHFPYFFYEMLMAVYCKAGERVMELKTQGFFLMKQENKAQQSKQVQATCSNPQSFPCLPGYLLLCYVAEAGLQGLFEHNPLYNNALRPHETTADLAFDLELFANSLIKDVEAWHGQFRSLFDQKIDVCSIRGGIKTQKRTFAHHDLTASLKHSQESCKKTKFPGNETRGQRNASVNTPEPEPTGLLDKYFLVHSGPESKKAFPLQDLWNSHPDRCKHPLTAEIAARLQSSYDGYQPIFYSFRSPEAKLGFCIEAGRLKELEINETQRLTKEILRVLHDLAAPLEEGAFLEQACKKLGGLDKEKGMEEALDWMVSLEGRLLTEEEGRLLYLLRSYILRTIRLYLFTKIEDKLKSASATDQELGVLAAFCHHEMTPVDGFYNKLLLYFEYKSGKVLRDKQFLLLQDICRSMRQVYQLGCGEGKTTVLKVVLGFMESELKNMVVNVVPSPLLHNDIRQLQKSFSEISMRKVHVFQFNRQTPLEIERLKMVQEQLGKAAASKNIIVAEPQAVQSLFLCYLQELERLDANSAGNARLQIVQGILKMFLNRSTALIDEVHAILKATHHLIYAVGEEVELPGWRWKETGLLFQDMLDINRQNDCLFFFPLGHRYNELWSEDVYREKLLPRLASYAVERLLPAEGQDLALEYICCIAAKTPAEKRKRLQLWLDGSPPMLREKLKFLRAQFQCYLPRTLQGRLTVNYGPSKTSETAIPYDDHQNPGKKSQFESIDVLINYTYQMYFIKGLSKEQVEKLLKDWQNQYFTEFFSGRPAFAETLEQKLQSFVPSASFETLDLHDPVCLDFWHQRLALERNMVFDYVQTHVFPQLAMQNEKLWSGPQDLGSILFKKIIAFSGTPSNYVNYPADMPCHFDAAADGEALHLLFDPAWTSLTYDPGHFQQFPFSYCMLMDPKAYLEGNSNQAIAEKLLQCTSADITHVQFFDDKNRLVMLDRHKRIQPANSSLCAPEQRVTYCDQQHSTGTDTIQPPHGKGLLLVNVGLTFTELVQGAKRMRQWGQGQKIVLWCAPKAYIEIMARYKEMTMASLVMWCVENESAGLDKTLVFSFSEQVQSVFRKAALFKIIETPGMKAKKQLFSHYRGLFIKKLELNEYALIASLDDPAPPLEQFDATLAQYKTAYRDLLSAEAKNELRVITDRARGLLAGLTNEERHSEKGDMTMQLEQDCMQSKQIQVEKNLIEYIPIRWKPRALLCSQAFIERFVNAPSKDLAGSGFISHTMPPLHIEPLGRVFPKAHFDGSLFATENFFCRKAVNHRILPQTSSKCDIQLFKKYLPAVKYLLCVKPTGKNDQACYILLGVTEADKLRKWINNLASPIILKGFALALYDEKGRIWARSSNFTTDEKIMRIIGQIHFLNGDSFYEREILEQMQIWIHEPESADRLEFLQDMQALRRKPWEGTIWQDIFLKRDLNSLRPSIKLPPVKL